MKKTKLTDHDKVAAFMEEPAYLRPPYWRYTIAQHAAADPLSDLSPLATDAYLLNGAVRMRESTIDVVRRKLVPKAPKNRYDAIVPAVKDAFRLHASGCTRNVKWAAEALLLTGASDEKVGQKLCMPKDVVKAYRKIFFDVDPFLGNTDAMMLNVLPMSWSRCNQGMTWDLGWKLAALEDGWDGVLNCIRGTPEAGQMLKLFQRQAFRSLEHADLLLQKRTCDMNEDATAAIKVAQDYWKLILDSRLAALNAAQSAAQSFYNGLVPIVEKALEEATPVAGSAVELLITG